MKIETILVVDDEEDICTLLKTFLDEQGYTVSVATDGHSALELVAHEQPDLVFLDMKLHGMDGLEIIERINKLEQKPLVVMLSGHGTTQLEKMLLKKGAFAYLYKPIALEQLTEIICLAELAMAS